MLQWTVKNLENRRVRPKLETARAIAAALDLSVDKFPVKDEPRAKGKDRARLGDNGAAGAENVHRNPNASPGAPLALVVPPGLIEEIARRVAELVAERRPEASPYLDAEEPPYPPLQAAADLRPHPRGFT